MGARKRARLADELTQAEGCCSLSIKKKKRLFSSTSRAIEPDGAERIGDTDLQKGV